MNDIISNYSDYLEKYGTKPLEVIVGKLLKQKGPTLCVAESCTGGLVSSLLTDVSGSSDYIKLNFVTYSNEAKIKILGVERKTLEKYGAVSEQTAVQMAQGARKVAACDIGLGITGIAGPAGGTPEKPVGLVYISVCDNVNCRALELRLNSSNCRKEIKLLASLNALNLLLEFLSDKR